MGIEKNLKKKERKSIIKKKKKENEEKFKIDFTLQPREQKVKESRRLRSQTRQVFVTPLPGLG